MKADFLSKYASSKVENYIGTVYWEVLRTPTIKIKLMAPISEGSCWMDPIRAHLEIGWFPSDNMEARKITFKALRYVFIDGVLYKKCVSGLILKILETSRGRDSIRGST